MTGKTIVVGGWISGLACGFRLGKRCIILEKDSCVGGLSKTKEHRGFKFDLGGHRFFTNDPETDAFFKSLLEGQLVEVERKSSIYWREKFVEYPLKINIIYRMNPVDILTCLITYLLRYIKPIRGNSFESTAKNRFGDKLYTMFFKGYTEKVWGLKCTELSSELADTRLQRISLWRVLKHSILPSNKVKSFVDLFQYPKEGIGILSDSLSKNLDVRLDSKVVGLLTEGNRIVKVVVEGGEEYGCENLVSTMPLTDLLPMLDPPKDVLDHSEKLRYRDLICVFIVLDMERYSGCHWIYFPDKELFGRIHEPKNWSAQMALKDSTGICVEFFCNRGDAIWGTTDEELVTEIIKGLPNIGKDDVLNQDIVRVKNAYPIYSLDYAIHLETIGNYLSKFENLHLLGRTGSFRYDNMDVCLKDGLELGEKILLETDAQPSSLHSGN